MYKLILRCEDYWKYIYIYLEFYLFINATEVYGEAKLVVFHLSTRGGFCLIQQSFVHLYMWSMHPFVAYYVYILVPYMFIYMYIYIIERERGT